MNKGNKFSICLMNPPYDRDMHLKFIDKCINICEKLINISPGGFINNIGMYNTKTKLTQNIIKHLKDVEFIDVEKSNKYFGLGKNGIKSELHIGLYEHDYTDGKPILDENVLNVYKKIRYTCQTNLRNHFINKEKFGKYSVRIFRMHYDGNTPYYDNIICTQGKAVEGIDFKTENEKNNFIKSIHTWVYEFMFKLEDTNPAHLPYLDDYTKEWTDERLYKLFDINSDEQNLIDETIEKFEWHNKYYKKLCEEEID